MNDEQLLVALLNREENAVKYLYETHWPMIKSFVILNNGTETDAKDIFQDGILDFLEKVWKGNLVLTCKLKTYLYAVCKYKWLNTLRKKMRASVVVDLDEIVELYPVYDDSVQGLHQNQDLKAAVIALGEPCKSLLIGYYYEELSMEQMTAKLGYNSAKVVKQQKFRCKERLKQTLLKLMKNDFS